MISPSAVTDVKICSLGKYWRVKPLAFSFVPRSQEA